MGSWEHRIRNGKMRNYRMAEIASEVLDSIKHDMVNFYFLVLRHRMKPRVL